VDWEIRWPGRIGPHQAIVAQSKWEAGSTLLVNIREQRLETLTMCYILARQMRIGHTHEGNCECGSRVATGIEL